MDKYDLYTLCVQDPPRYVRFLQAIHGGNAQVLRDDFAGAGALARAWALSDKRRRAIAVDADSVPLKKAKHPRVKLDAVDVRKSKAVADIIAALNFGVCELHTRRALMAYLKNARKTLKPGGVIVCDLYGGKDMWRSKTWSQKFKTATGRHIVYTWQQISASETTGMVHNAMHFDEVVGGRIGKTHFRAFEYHWRLWSIAELREAMHEAGFGVVDVYDRIGSAMDSDGNLFVDPVTADQPLDKSWVVYIAGRR